MSINRGTGPNDDDLLALLLLGTGLVVFGIINVGAISSGAVQWLLAHQVLVPAGRGLVDLPGGAALDLPRIAAAVGTVVVLVAVFGVGRRRRDAAAGER